MKVLCYEWHARLQIRGFFCYSSIYMEYIAILLSALTDMAVLFIALCCTWNLPYCRIQSANILFIDEKRLNRIWTSTDDR